MFAKLHLHCKSETREDFSADLLYQESSEESLVSFSVNCIGLVVTSLGIQDKVEGKQTHTRRSCFFGKIERKFLFTHTCRETSILFTFICCCLLLKGFKRRNTAKVESMTC